MSINLLIQAKIIDTVDLHLYYSFYVFIVFCVLRTGSSLD